MRKSISVTRRLLAFILVLTMYISMLSINSMAIEESEKVLVCGLEEHTHTDACYGEPQLICDLQESPGHQHTEDCYTVTRSEPKCGYADHSHSDECFDEEGTLICTEHVHTDDCYDQTKVLTCDLEEGEGAHTHDDSCYEVPLICDKIEHTHDDSCYAKPAEPNLDQEQTQATPTPGVEESTPSEKPSEDPSDSTTPTPTEEPIVSETPAPTVEPITSEAPAPTDEPISSETPAPTAEPTSSEVPTPTEEPAVSKTPTPTQGPEVPVTPTKVPMWGDSGMEGPGIEEPISALIDEEYYPTLQAAIDDVADGATITLMADVAELISSSSKNYTLNLNNHTITGKVNKSAVVQVIGGNVTIMNGTITGGAPTTSSSKLTGGRGINVINATLNLNNVIVTGNNGGGIYAEESTVQMTACTISGNTTTGSGAGIYLNKSPLTVTDCTFSENEATTQGGAVYISSGEFTSLNTDYINNVATGIGVAIYDNSSSNKGKSVVITGGLFSGNSSVTIDSSLIKLSCNIQISDATITGNSTGSLISHSPVSGEITESVLDNLTIKDNNSRGPLISFSEIGCSITIENCHIENNTVTTYSTTAPIRLSTEGEGSTNIISNCTISNNTFSSSSTSYGAIYLQRKSTVKAFVQSKTAIKNCTIENNQGIKATLYFTQQIVDITGGTISGNTGTSTGGIHVVKGATVTATGTKITNNTSTGTSISAGGIYNDGTLTLNDVVVSENTNTYVTTGTSSVAGGITNNSNGSLTLIDTVIKDNIGRTGGLYEQGENYSYLTMISGAIYNNRNHSDEASDLFSYYKAENQTYIPANEMTDDGFDFSGYTWSLKGQKADKPNKSSDSTSVWIVVRDEVAPAVEIVHSDNSAEQYTDFADAIRDVKDGETIRLLKSKVTSPKSITLTDKSITIDLNGNGLYLDPSNSTSAALFIVKGNKTLTIKGSGVIGQYISIGDSAGSRENYKGHLIIDATGDISFASLRTDSYYKPIVCVNGQVDVRGSGTIKELTANIIDLGSFIMENGVTIGTLNITFYGSEDVTNEFNGNIDILNLSQFGPVKATLNGTIKDLTLKHFKSVSTDVPETYAGDDFKLTGHLEFYPVGLSIYNTSEESGFPPVDMANPLEDSPDIIAIRGALNDKINLENAVWVNTVGGDNKKELIWKIENGGNGLDYYNSIQFDFNNQGNLVLTKHFDLVMIYLGDPSSEGTEAPIDHVTVSTFDSAKSLAKKNDINTIYIRKPIIITGKEEWDGDGLILQRADVLEESEGNMILVPSGSELTLKNITIDGSSEIGEYQTHPVKGSLIEVYGTLNIESGTTLQHNRKTQNGNDFSDVGGAIYANGGTVNMYPGATIKDNCASFGGGIGLYHGATFNMYGGQISGNKALGKDNAAGGGVLLAYDSVMNMSSGRIDGNTSSYWGGGIALGAKNENLEKDGMTQLNLKGGTVSNNKSSKNGGGIFIQANCTANIIADADKEVYITGNSCYGGNFGGGGIYVNGRSTTSSAGIKNGLVKLEKVEIARNLAGSSAFSNKGGAIAACPSSNVSIYLNNGSVIHDNTTSSTLYISGIMQLGISGIHVGSPDIVLSDFMMGGGRYNWINVIGKMPQINEHAEYRLNSGSEWFMNTDASDSANIVKNGIALTNVHITDNTSTTIGGGIGSNGNIEIGTDNKALRIEKTVDGPAARDHLTDVVRFELTFSTAFTQPITMLRNGQYEDGLTPVEGKENAYTFTMKANDVILLSGIPEGTPYTITEIGPTDSDQVKADDVKVEYTISTVGTKTEHDKTVSGEILGDNHVTSVVYTNIYIPKIYLTVTKNWNDNGAAYTRPSEVKFALYRNGERMEGEQYTYVMTPDEKGNWPSGPVKAFKDLPTCYYDFENDTFVPYEYTIKEELSEKDGYSVKCEVFDIIEASMSYGFGGQGKVIGYTWVFTNTPETIKIEVEKIWNDSNLLHGEDCRPGKIVFSLYRDNEGEPIQTYEMTPNENGKWPSGPVEAFKELSKYHFVDDKLTPYEYSVQEETIEGYTIKSVKQTLSEATYDRATGMVSGSITYDRWTFTNTPETVKIGVSKWWMDDGDTAGRPDQLVFELLRDGKKIDEYVMEPDKNGNWPSKTFEPLPKYHYDADGKAIEYEYEIVEQKLDGYSTEVRKDEITETTASYSKTDGYSYTKKVLGYTYVFTNTQDTIKIQVEKKWAGNSVNRPGSITFDLYRDGKLYDGVEPYVLKPDETGKWPEGPVDAFKSLLRYYYVNGVLTAYNYEVKERAVTGYSATSSKTNIVGEKTDSEPAPFLGYKWTFTNTPETIEINVTKHWDDKGYESQRPDKIDFQLLRDNEVIETKSMTRNADGTWPTITFENLLKYHYDSDGKAVAYEYTVKEGSVTGYTVKDEHYPIIEATLSQGIGGVGKTVGYNWVFTNTHTPPPPEETPAEPTPSQPDEPTPSQPDEPTPSQPDEPTPSQPDEPTPTPPTNPPTPDNPPPEENDRPNEPQNPNEPDTPEDNPNQDIPNRDVPQEDAPNVPDEPNVPNPQENNPNQDMPNQDTPFDDRPGQPDTPNDEPGTDLPDEDVPQSDTPPRTGETVMNLIWLTMMVASGAGIVLTALSKKREEA